MHNRIHRERQRAKQRELAENIIKSLRLKDVMEREGVHFNSKGFARCPFHTEKTASLTIKKEHYKCFGCGAYGNAIDFIIQYKGIGYYQALQKLDSDFQLGYVTNKKPSYRERAQMSENRRLEQAYQEYKENVHQNYLRLCTVHSVLYRQFCKGNESVRDTVEELDRILDDFTGEEARLWME